jgi:gamma-glutamyltranspeptidase/glutathione hydrolase
VLENGVPLPVRDELARRGHRIVPADGSLGGYQAILRNDNGLYEAASEMRKDGLALAY